MIMKKKTFFAALGANSRDLIDIHPRYVQRREKRKICYFFLSSFVHLLIFFSLNVLICKEEKEKLINGEPHEVNLKYLMMPDLLQDV